MGTLAGLTEGQIREDSLLPGWTVGHVLTHLARNADAHVRRLRGALMGEDIPKYAGGADERMAQIQNGAGRGLTSILTDLEGSISQLDSVMSECTAAGWPNSGLGVEQGYGVAACPAHRLREVEMHHADLGVGYGPSDWPEEYVAWDLPLLLRTVPARLSEPSERRALMAWLSGRGDLPAALDLEPWG